MRNRDYSGQRAIRLARGSAGIAVAVLAGALVSSCAAGTGTAPPPASPALVPSPPASSAAPSRVDTAQQAAITAYIGMWKDVAAASTTSDWRSSLLARDATGDALSVLSRTLYADHYNGVVSRGQPDNRPQVSSVDPPGAPTTVMISDCGDDSHWLKYRADNGQLADNMPGGRRSITAEVKLAQDGSWKVTRFAVEAVGTC